MNVPSLIFAFNSQKIIDCIAGVRSETPEQFQERIKQNNINYVKHFIDNHVLKQDPLRDQILNSLTYIKEVGESHSLSVSSRSLNIVSEKDSEEEMYKKFAQYTKESLLNQKTPKPPSPMTQTKKQRES